MKRILLVIGIIVWLLITFNVLTRLPTCATGPGIDHPLLPPDFCNTANPNNQFNPPVAAIWITQPEKQHTITNSHDYLWLFMIVHEDNNRLSFFRIAPNETKIIYDGIGLGFGFWIEFRYLEMALQYWRQTAPDKFK